MRLPSPALSERPNRLPHRRPDRLPVLLGALCLAAMALSLYAMRGTDLRGDEYTYVAGAQSLALAFSGHLPIPVAIDRILGTGWFMPGIEVLGAPLFLIVHHPALWAIRLWFGSVSIALLAGLVIAFHRVIGRPAAMLLLLFPGLAAGWSLLALTALADPAAGLIATMALLATYRIARTILRDGDIRWRSLVLLEALLTAGFYLRGPLILLPLAMHAFLLTLALAGRTRPGIAARLLVGGVLCLVMLAPWSLAASHRFKAPVLTTTNFPLVFADSFGDPQRTCFGPCPAGVDIWPAWRVSQDIANRTGANPLSIQKQMMAASIAGLTPTAYLHKVRQHFIPFLLQPTEQLRGYLPVAYAIPPAWRGTWLSAITAVTWIIYAPFLLALMLVNLMTFTTDADQRVQSLLLKAATACLFLEPFFHKSNGRYWTTMAPLAAWAAALLLQRLLSSSKRQQANVAPEAPPAIILPRVFDHLQTGWAMLFAGTALVLVLA